MSVAFRGSVVKMSKAPSQPNVWREIAKVADMTVGDIGYVFGKWTTPLTVVKVNPKTIVTETPSGRQYKWYRANGRLANKRYHGGTHIVPLNSETKRDVEAAKERTEAIRREDERRGSAPRPTTLLGVRSGDTVYLDGEPTTVKQVIIGKAIVTPCGVYSANDGRALRGEDGRITVEVQDGR